MNPPNRATIAASRSQVLREIEKLRTDELQPMKEALAEINQRLRGIEVVMLVAEGCLLAIMEHFDIEPELTQELQAAREAYEEVWADERSGR